MHAQTERGVTVKPRGRGAFALSSTFSNWKAVSARGFFRTVQHLDPRQYGRLRHAVDTSLFFLIMRRSFFLRLDQPGFRQTVRSFEAFCPGDGSYR
ncbi:MAG TPA: hypothetical protein VHK24_10135 [Steroidobacter sp.]|nr:hypothetical protein [Steroidobacter sp.]